MARPERTRLERDLAALVLRGTVGGLLLFHGLDKVTGGIAWLPDLLEARGLPGALAYGVYLGEIVAPVLLILGIAPRLSGLAIAATLAVAVYLLHTDDLLSLGEHGAYALEIQAFYVSGAIASALLGPGRFALPTPRWLARL